MDMEKLVEGRFTSTNLPDEIPFEPFIDGVGELRKAVFGAASDADVGELDVGSVQFGRWMLRGLNGVGNCSILFAKMEMTRSAAPPDNWIGYAQVRPTQDDSVFGFSADDFDGVADGTALEVACDGNATYALVRIDGFPKNSNTERKFFLDYLLSRGDWVEYNIMRSLDMGFAFYDGKWHQPLRHRSSAEFSVF